MRATVLLSATFLSGLLLALRSPTDERIASVAIDPKATPITMHWADDSGNALGNIGRLKAYIERKGEHLGFAMNGGMYMEDQRPLGLYIEDGRTVRRLITRTEGYGNFYMQPNGVFGIHTNGLPFLVNTSAYHEVTEVSYATQSGPMLVVDGHINQAFKQGSPNVHIRNGVGLRQDGHVLFAISKEPVNFHDFASFFLEQGCRNALFLDGTISQAYMPAEGLSQLGGHLGVLIATTQ